MSSEGWYLWETFETDRRARQKFPETGGFRGEFPIGCETLEHARGAFFASREEALAEAHEARKKLLPMKGRWQLWLTPAHESIRMQAKLPNARDHARAIQSIAKELGVTIVENRDDGDFLTQTLVGPKKVDWSSNPMVAYLVRLDRAFNTLTTFSLITGSDDDPVKVRPELLDSHELAMQRRLIEHLDIATPRKKPMV